MSQWTLAQAAQALSARLVGNGKLCPSELSLDSRALRSGACFVALRAQRDGHEFAAQAVAKGAAALLVDHELDIDCPQLVVADTTLALQRWGQARLEAARPKHVFGVTGSVGKTSTKELLASATSAWKTPGNRNNTLGMPEALATLPDGLEAAVLEMGMSSPGEIRRLVEIAPLDFGLITNVGTAHQENFPEGQQGIARAKGELLEGLRPGAPWAHLASDDWCRWITLQPWAQHVKAIAVGEGCAFGWENTRSLGAQGEFFELRTPGGTVPVQLRLRGHHQVGNAALAGTIAFFAGFDLERIAHGLSQVEPEAGRGRLHALEDGSWLLDESYNASVDSILACAKALLALPGGESVAVLGCMRELGSAAEKLHEETGSALKSLGLDRLLVYGDHAQPMAKAFGRGASAYPQFEALRDAEDGLSAISRGARILVKGSRFWQSERAVAWLLSQRGRPSRNSEILG